VQYDLEGLSVLLVENSQHMRRIIRTILNSLGVKKIAEAEDAAAGLKLSQETDVDLIICSWHAEVIDGPEFVKMVRSDEASRNPFVPIIMLSAFTEKFRITKARDAGVNEFLAKPISPKSLYQRIATIIEKPRPFIRTDSYFGPCRRRRTLGPPKGCVERRVANPTPVTARSEKLQDIT
jgi:CheY-like chemotaxis protein